MATSSSSLSNIHTCALTNPLSMALLIGVVSLCLATTFPCTRLACMQPRVKNNNVEVRILAKTQDWNNTYGF